MKKGFTLVELLAVIVILAVILVIAIPQVLKVVDNSRINAYLKNEQMVLKAVDLYVSRNTGSLPGEVGSTTEVSINYLVSNGMLTEITNPYNKSEDCTGYVTIMKLSDTGYNYTPHLRCGLDIHNSSDDGLVLHYKFDDFQEPTENFATGIINVWRDLFVSDYSHEVLGNGYLITTTDYNEANSSVRIFLTGFFDTQSEYTLSFYTDKPHYFTRMNMRNGSTNMGGNTNFEIENFGLYSRLSINISGGHLDNNFNILRLYPINNEIADIFISNIQFEKKPYATPFVDVIREGVVKDYSGNGNHANLELNTTPRWINNSKAGNGAYEFNGENSYIHVNGDASMELNGGETISLWTKPKGSGFLFFQHTSWSRRIDYSSNRFRLIVYDEDRGFHSIETHNNYNIDQYYNVVYTFNEENILKLYVNGELQASKDIGKPLDRTNSYWWIGRSCSGSSCDLYYIGIIDDFRIYNRSLSDKEIKLLYESTK